MSGNRFKISIESKTPTDPAIAQIDTERVNDDPAISSPDSNKKDRDPALSETTKKNEDKAIPNDIEIIGVVLEDDNPEIILQKTPNKNQVNPDLAVSGKNTPIGDPAVDVDTQIIGADVDTVGQATAIEAFRNEVYTNISETNRTIDTIVGLSKLKSAAECITSPTYAEMRLFTIASELAVAGTEVSPTDLVPATESFGELAGKIRDTIVGAAKSVRGSIGNIFKSFSSYFKRLGFTMGEWKGRISKLRAMVDSIKKRASRNEAIVEIKNDALLYTGDATGKKVVPIADGAHLADEFKAFAETMKSFTEQITKSVITYSGNYSMIYNTLFSNRLEYAGVVAEKDRFKNDFIEPLNASIPDNIVTLDPLKKTTRSRYYLSGVYFGTEFGNDSVLRTDDVSDIVKLMDQCSFGAAFFDGKASFVTRDSRDFAISIQNIESILETIDDVVQSFAVTYGNTVSRAIEEIGEAAENYDAVEYDDATGEGYYVNRSFQYENGVARILVQQSKAIVDGYTSTEAVVTYVLKQLTKVLYDVVISKKWDEQDLATI